MLVIGLTGGIASGKSTVAHLLRARGAAVIDADKAGHRVIAKGAPGWQDVIAAFGPEVLTATGEIDRAALGAIVFRSPEALAKLNAISHPRIRELVMAELRDLAERQSTAVAVIDAALLYEANWDTMCDEVWVVYAPVEVAVARLAARNGLSIDDAWARVRAQLPPEHKRDRADVVIDNTGTLADLERQVDRAWEAAVARAHCRTSRRRSAAGEPTHD
ncbi:MAG: dephospho-CoA kinase [Dehalococcoidia bacterium]|nr:dephospho-CoA kinase [Dehalococcoidia bacterium]